MIERLMEEGRLNLTEISQEVGCSDAVISAGNLNANMGCLRMNTGGRSYSNRRIPWTKGKKKTSE